MKQYIDKSAVVAEIEKLLHKDKYSTEYVNGKKYALKAILSFINTLEVKEVDLGLNSFDATVCKNGNTYLKEIDSDAICKSVEPFKEGDKVKVIIKAQKGE